MLRPLCECDPGCWRGSGAPDAQQTGCRLLAALWQANADVQQSSRGHHPVCTGTCIWYRYDRLQTPLHTVAQSSCMQAAGHMPILSLIMSKQRCTSAVSACCNGSFACRSCFQPFGNAVRELSSRCAIRLLQHKLWHIRAQLPGLSLRHLCKAAAW